MTVVSSPTTRQNTHHVKLSKGGTDLGLILSDMRGNENPGAIDLQAMSDAGLKIYSGEIEYSDLQLPATAQKDWSGGQGKEVFEDDKTRYLQGVIDSSLSGKLINPPRVNYTKGAVRTWYGDQYAGTTYVGLYGSNLYRATRINASVTSIAVGDSIWFWMRKYGTPTATFPTIQIWTDGGTGTPVSSVATLSFFSDLSRDYLLVQIVIYQFDATYSDANGFDIVFIGDAADTSANHWQLLATNRSGCKASANGVTWTAPTDFAGSPSYRYCVGTTQFVPHFAEYKGCIHVGTEPADGSAGKLYREGYQGACDANTAALGTLKDATQTTGWAAEPATRAQVNIYDGVSVNEGERFREVDAWASGEIDVNVVWKYIHDTVTNYFIRGTDTFHEITAAAVTKPITDMAVANEILYLAQGNQANIIMHRGFNNNGAWLEQDSGAILCWLDSKAKAHKLHVREDATLGQVLYAIYHNPYYHFESNIIQQVAPLKWSNVAQLSGIMLEDCADVWDEQDPAIANVTMTYTDEHMVKAEIAAGFATGIICSEAISSVDIRQCNKIVMHIISSIDLEAEDLQLLLDNTAECASPILLANFPALRANTPTEVTFTFDTTDVVGFEAVISIGLKLIVNQAAFNLYLYGPIYAVKDYAPIEFQERVSSMCNYGETSDEIWALTRSKVGRINDNQFVPEQIYALDAVKSDQNGIASCANDVYLYFSYGNEGGILRYYNGTLDNVGPSNDYGLPSDRDGSVAWIKPHAGCVYAAINGGANGYSCVIKISGSSISELYRTPYTNMQIQGGAFVQNLKETDCDRLYFGVTSGVGTDILFIDIDLNPLQNGRYEQSYEGWLQTGKIALSMIETEKFFRSLKIVQERNASGTVPTVDVDYRVDGEYSNDWAPIRGFNTEPSEELNIGSNDKEGNYIELRLRLLSDYPTVLAWVMEYIQRLPVVWSWVITFKLEDDAKDLNGLAETQTAKQKLDQLKTWLASPLPVTVSSMCSILNGITAYIPAPSLKTIKQIEERDRRKEVYICQLRLVEI